MKYEYIGWCKKDNHDKVWGILRLDRNKCLTFWGRRGAKLQTKMVIAGIWEAEDMFLKKESKGYTNIPKSNLDKIYPEFQADLEKTAMWAMLKM